MSPSTCPARGSADLKLHAPGPESSGHARRLMLATPITVTTWTAEEWADLPDPPPGALECPNGVRFLVEQD